MNDWKVKFTAELDTTQLEQQVNQKISELDGKKVKFGVDGGNAQKEVEKVDNSIKSATKSTKTFGDTLKTSAKLGAAYSITSQAFQAIREAASAAKEAVQEIDAAVMDLRMATGATYTEVSNLVKEYNELGQAIGATTKEVSSGADSWQRQGHSIADTNTLIRDSMILSKVAKLESAKATSYLTSIMKGYKIEIENVIGIVDRLTSVDLVSAVDAGGIAEGISKTAVSANTAGVSLDKLIGYLAATGEVTQESMSVIGNAFKTFFARYSAIKSGKLELIDEDGTIEVLSDVEQSLKNVGIDIRTTITDFDNAGDVLDNLAEKWDNLNSVQKNAIASAFGGTRQKERFLVLMENYSQATSYMETSMNSAGTAEQKFEAYLDSLEAKTKSLQASFESLAINTFSTEMFGGIIDATSSVVTFLDKTNLLKGTLVGLTAAGAIKAFTMLTTGITNASIRLNEFNSALKLVKAGNIGEDKVQMLAKMTANLSQSQLKAVLSSKALSGEQRIAILTAQGLTKSEAEAALASMGLATAEGVAATSTFTLKGALKGLWATLMVNPLVLVIASIAGVISISSKLYQSFDELCEKTEESRTAYKNTVSELESLESELDSIKEKIKELNALDNPTLTEQEELDKLKSENDLLETQLKVKQKLAEYQKKESAKFAYDALTKKSIYQDGVWSMSDDGNALVDGINMNIVEQAKASQQKVNELDKKEIDLNNQLAQIDDPSSKQYKDIEKDLERLKEERRQIETDLSDDLSTISNLYDSLFDESGNLINSESLEIAEQIKELIDRLNVENIEVETATDSADYDSILSEVKSKVKDGVADNLDTLTPDELEIAADIENLAPAEGLKMPDDVYSSWESFKGLIDSISAKKLESSFTDTISKVDSLSTGLDQLSEIYQDVKDGGDFDYSKMLNNEDFEKSFGDLGSVYDDFIKTVSNSPSNISACQDAFNELTSAYISQKSALSGVTAETKDAVIARLKQMGITNALSVVERQLAVNEEKARIAKELGTNATWNKIASLYSEAEAGSATRQALGELLAAEISAGNVKLNTSANVQQIINIANAAGASTEVLASLREALAYFGGVYNSDKTKVSQNEAFYDKKGGNNPEKLFNDSKQAQDILANLQSKLDKGELFDLDATDFMVEYGGTGVTNGSDSGSGGQDNKPIDKFNKSVSKLFDWIEIKLDRLQTKTEKYFNKAEKLLEDGKFSSARNQYENAADATSKQIKANQKAEKEYKKTADDVLNKAISTGVISKKQAKSIKKKVNNGTIDISKYSDDVQTVIESYKGYYDKSVESGNNADTLLEQYEEYVEKMYNVPLERAAASIEALEDERSDLESKLDIAGTAKSQNNILDDITENAQSQLDTYKAEVKNTKSNLNKIWKSKDLKTALKSEANKGSKKGEELSTKGLKENSKEYKAVIKYNAALKAQQDALENATDAEVEYTKTLRENAKARFDNISAEYSSKQSQNEANLSLIETKVDSVYSTGKSQVTSEATRLYNSAIAENKSLISSYESELKALRDEYNKNSSKMSSEDRRDALNEIKSIEEDILKSQINIEKYQADIAELPFAELEKQLDLLEAIESKISSDVALKEAKGLDLSESDYNRQIANNKLQINNKTSAQNEAYKNYLSALASSNGAFGGKSSDEWLAEYNQYASEINNIKAENEKLKDSLRDDVYWRAFERAHEAAQRFSSTLSGIYSLVSDDMLFNSDGNLTDFGLAKLSLDIKQLENAREEVENYSDDIDNLNKLYKDGWYTEEEYKEKLSEIQVELLNSAESMKTYSDSIIDLYKDMAQAELDALFELIDARNEALSAKKEYYDYDKTIRNKTKDIQALQAQIAALEGIDNAEAKAKKAQLSADLAEAQEDLDDTINEHKLEIAQESLTDMKEVLQEAFDDKFTDIASNLDGIQQILSSANDLVDSRTSEINSNLAKLLEYYGINIKDLETNTGIDASNDGVASPYDSAINNVKNIANGVASLMSSLFSTEKAYASGTKYVPRKMRALTNEKGDEIIVTKDGLITPLEQGDGVVPAELTKRLYELASAELKIIPPSDMVNDEIYPELAKRFSASELQIAPTVNVQKFKAPNINTNIAPNITQHYDNLINIEGSADATTVADLKKMSKNIIAESYEYTTKKLYEDYIRSGGKRRI